jgi:cAMP phosphodiesterase
MLAVDGGTMVSGVEDVLNSQQSEGEEIFPSQVLPSQSDVKAQAWYVVREFLASICVTHEHLDHIWGFVLNSAAFSETKPKILAGMADCIDTLAHHVFNGLIWPNLTNEGIQPAGYITLNRLEPKKFTGGLATNLEVAAYAVSHGSHAEKQRRMSLPPAKYMSFSNTSSYESTAYFIRDTLTGKVILMWGDVEPDHISLTPRNAHVWFTASEFFQSGLLVAIFIECSFQSSHQDKLLFGHLTPKYLMMELSTFASRLPESLRLLPGLHIILTHIKDSPSGPFPGPAILDEVRALAKRSGFECTISLAVPGASYTF